MSDIEILELNLGGVILKEMTALTFFGWMAKQLNNVPITNDPRLSELRTAIAHPPIMTRIADESKIKYVRSLIALEILKV